MNDCVSDYSYGFVLRKEGSQPPLFLVVKQNMNWSFPKGHTESNEKPIETALRELREETGIVNLRVFENVSFVEKPYKYERDGVKYLKTNTYFLAETNEEPRVIDVGEIFEAEFISLSEFKNRTPFSECKMLLESIESYLNENI